MFTVEQGPILSQREITGEVIPAYQEQLFFRARGYVTRAGVKAGDMVEEGEVLAELQLEDLLDQLEQAQIDLEVAQDELANEQLQREYDLQKARSEVTILENQVQLADERFQKASGNQGSGAANKALEAETSQMDLEAAEAQLETARAWLNLVENKRSTTLEKDVRRKELSVERLERLVTERQIIAPFDGVILKNNLYEGSEIEAFAPAILIGDPDSLVVRIPVNTELSRILTEDTEVYLVGKNNLSEATFPIHYIPEILPVSEKKEGITIRGEDISLNFHYFAIPEGTPEEQLPILRAVLVRVILGKKDHALLLNPAAIRGIDEFKYVIVLEDDLHRRVEIVHIGLKTPDQWEIVPSGAPDGTGGLKPGDQVLGP